MHQQKMFVTLTYAGECEPSLSRSDIKQFLKALRYWNSYLDRSKSKRGKRVWKTLRYFGAGEYGSVNNRPHFHCLVFGACFPDWKPIGKQLWRSPTLEKLWPHGFSSVGTVTPASAGYVAKYSVKKINGDRASSHYCRVDTRTGEYVYVLPEFGFMSRRLGYSYWQKHWREMHAARDGVVLSGGITVPTPRAYMQWLAETCPDLHDSIQYDRYINSFKFADDTTAERLAVREHCAKAQFKQRKTQL